MAASCGDLEIAKQTQNEWIFCGRKGKGRQKGNGRENEGHLRHVQSKRNLEFLLQLYIVFGRFFSWDQD